MPLEEIVKRVNKIDGWFTGSQMAFMYEHLKQLRDNSFIVEIGTYRGKSTLLLALSCPKSYIMTIDPCNHPWSQEYNKAGFKYVNDTIDRKVLESGQVMQYVGTSQFIAKVFNIPIDFLFIDGLHEQCELDMKLWLPKVKKGGLVAFHDYDLPHPEVYETVNKFLKETTEFIMVEAKADMCIIQRL